MALKFACSGTESIELRDYIERIKAVLDPHDEDSIAETAPLLRALANDRTLVVRRLNSLVEKHFKGDAIPSAQAILLGHADQFYVRANIWPSSADIAAGRIYQEQFSYDLAHDHNFSFLTVPYSGSGYDTDLYEYDRKGVEGRIGESVPIQYLEQVHFTGDMVMLYRASRDIHVQHPPADMSMTLNLMVSVPEVRMREQHFFDLTEQTISGYPPESDSSKRRSFFDIASRLGDENTRGLLNDLMHSHPAPRTRLNAAESLSVMVGDTQIWEHAAADPAPMVRRAAALHLDQLNKGADSKD